MWQIAVYNRDQHEQFEAAEPRLTLRQGDDGRCWRPAAEEYTRDAPSLALHFGDGVVVVKSHGVRDAIELPGGGSFTSAVPTEIPLPSVFRVGDTWLEVRGSQHSPLAGSLEPLPAEGDAAATLATHGHAGPDAATVSKWLAAVGRLHRTAASAHDFFDVAANIVIETTGLDAALILTRDASQWHIAGSALPRPEHGIAYDRGCLERLLDQPIAWRRPTPPANAPPEVEAFDSIVVAPVRDATGEVVGAVYGVRHARGANRRRGIRALEARLLQVIAEAVATGLARREQEIQCARQRVLLEQAFSPAIADQLQRNPQALASAEREVSLLFADLRSFTAIAENLSPAAAYDLLAAVMERLTQIIMDHGGVVIDYFGDGVSAMFNAPLDVPDHADRACAAALDMLAALPEVSRQWAGLLAAPLELGVGVHAARVQVGNAGTAHRLKYGPRGHGVNVASRIQAATRQLDVPLLVTDAVRRRLSSRFITLKACTARLPGLEEPLDVFTLFPASDGVRLQDAMARYASALDAFERGDLDGAEKTLQELLAAGPTTPAPFLSEHAAALRRSAAGRRSSDQQGIASSAVVEIHAK